MSPRDQSHFKGLSARATALLGRDENLSVDFKQSPSGVEAEDFVQFANSPTGGALLIGVKEISDEKGHQRGEIIGCEITDKNKLLILGKASSCIPPISVQIFVENLARKKPFYRVEIPSGPHKPYCTNSGTYKIRLDGRKLALHPPHLLQLFLDAQAGQFIQRFSQATKELEDELGSVSAQLERLESDVEVRLGEIFNTADNAGSLADEAMNNSDEAFSMIEHHASESLSNQETIIHKLGLLLHHLKVEDPREAQLVEWLSSLSGKRKS